jgi:hypothetical protein
MRMLARSLVLAATAPLTVRAMATSAKATLPANVQASLPDLYQTALHPLDFSKNVVTMQPETKTLQQVIQATGSMSTVAFVVRRPG